MVTSTARVRDRDDFRKAMRLKPDLAGPYAVLAWLRATSPDATIRDGKESVKLATRACELYNWKSSWATGVLSAAFAEVGDFEAAIKWIKKAMEMNSTVRDFLRAEMLELFLAKKPYRDQANQWFYETAR